VIEGVAAECSDVIPERLEIVMYIAYYILLNNSGFPLFVVLPVLWPLPRSQRSGLLLVAGHVMLVFVCSVGLLSGCESSRGRIQTCPADPHLMYIWCNIYLFIRSAKVRGCHHWQGHQLEARTVAELLKDAKFCLYVTRIWCELDCHVSVYCAPILYGVKDAPGFPLCGGHGEKCGQISRNCSTYSSHEVLEGGHIAGGLGGGREETQ
jgi:hypothetical protein